MKGPLALLLVGGGVILIVGLFTGKITFPGQGGNTSPLAAVGGVDPNASSGVKVTQNGKTTTLTNAQWRAIAGQNGV